MLNILAIQFIPKLNNLQHKPRFINNSTKELIPDNITWDEWIDITEFPFIEITIITPYKFRYKDTKLEIEEKYNDGNHQAMIYGRYYSTLYLVLSTFRPTDNMEYRNVQFKNKIPKLNYDESDLEWGNVQNKAVNHIYRKLRSYKLLSDEIRNYINLPRINIKIGNVDCEVLKLNSKYAISKYKVNDNTSTLIQNDKHLQITLNTSRYKVYEIKTGEEATIKLSDDGHYILYELHGHYKGLNRISAIQFCKCHDLYNNIIVDHKNGDSFDDSPENLRFVSWDTNTNNQHTRNRNLSKLHSLPANTLKILSYNGNYFKNLYYNSELNKAYYYNSFKCVELVINYSQKGKYINCKDVECHTRRVYVDSCEFEVDDGIVGDSNVGSNSDM